jgi:hypothetical protein
MATPNRFSVYLGGVLVASAWSLHAAQEKLTAAVLIRAQERGSFPVEGLIYNSTGQKLAHREFPCFFSSDSDAPLYGITGEQS